MVKAIIFDFDGVIVESVDVKTQAFRALFKDYPKQLEEIIKYHLHNGGISRFDKFRFIYKNFLKEELTENKFSELCNDFSELVMEEVISAPFVKGADELLGKALNNYEMFVVSGTPETEIKEIIRRRGLGKYFSGVFGSPSAKTQLINAILKENKLKSDEVVFVGDSVNDFNAARETGAHFIARAHNKNLKWLNDGNTLAIFEDFSSISNFFDVIKGKNRPVAINPNCNYHVVNGRDILDSQEERFKNYRKMWIDNPRNFIVNDFPLHLDIEATNICNLKCPYCAVTTDSWGSSKRGMLSLATFKKIIDEGADNGLCSVKYSFRGESLLNKDLPEMIVYAKKNKILDMYFNTNGVLLTREMSERLIDAGLNRISISADGWDKDSFEKNRKGAKFDVVYKNIEQLRLLREKRRVDFPRIRIQAVMLKELRENWKEYLKVWQPLADELGYLDARKEGAGIDHRGMKEAWACPFLWQRMVILWDGVILPCLMHGVQDLSLMALGNIKTTKIKDAWNSQRNNKYREIHKNGQAHLIEACDRCSYRALEINKLRGLAEEVML